jgi:hypothetical protein
VRAELSHEVPDGRLEDVLHHRIRVTLAQRAKERRTTPSWTTAPSTWPAPSRAGRPSG